MIDPKMGRWLGRVGFVVATAIRVSSPLSGQTPGPPVRFGCHEPFGTGLSLADLSLRFGRAAVESRTIYLGEGVSQKGAVLFPDSADELEILWNDTERQRAPREIRVRQQGSRWTTREGLAIGMRLHEVERLNEKPFRLLGFGWDAGGTLMSWSGGRLTRSATGDCRLRLRFRHSADATDTRIARAVTGSAEFSSSHPAMQRLNPAISEMWLEFHLAF